MRAEQNDFLTRTGPGTPMGELFRRYWLPALLAEELPGPDCPPVRVRMLGEKLVAFRDTQNRLGLIDFGAVGRACEAAPRARATQPRRRRRFRLGERRWRRQAEHANR